MPGSPLSSLCDVLDLLLLLLLHKKQPRRKTEESIIKKKIKAIIFTEELLTPTFLMHIGPLKQHMVVVKVFLALTMEVAMASALTELVERFEG